MGQVTKVSQMSHQAIHTSGIQSDTEDLPAYLCPLPCRRTARTLHSMSEDKGGGRDGSDEDYDLGQQGRSASKSAPHMQTTAAPPQLKQSELNSAPTACKVRSALMMVTWTGIWTSNEIKVPFCVLIASHVLCMLIYGR